MGSGTEYYVVTVGGRTNAGALVEHFQRTCCDRHSSVATIWLPDGRTVTFDELREQYGLLRNTLQEAGVEAGSCVMSMVGNLPEFVPLLVACMHIGAALLPLGEATDTEALALARNAGAAAVITHRALPFESSSMTRISEAVAITRIADSSPRRAYPESVVLKLTSGSTEMPKTTIATEAALIRDAQCIAHGMGIGPDDVNLAAIPLSHAYAIGNIVLQLILQGTRTALRPAFSPSQFVRDVRTARVSVFPGVPFMFDHLRGTLADRSIPESLRLLISAGARLDSATVRWFNEHVARKIHSFYGTSETGGITYDSSNDISEPLHVGWPLAGVTVNIQSASDTGAGRVFVRSGGLAQGYVSASDNEAESAFQQGGFLTGDLGYFDGKGRLVLTGRVSPLVNVAGRKVDPGEVERLVSGLPGVTDARVVGVASETRGQELVAFVVRGDAGLTALALRRFCADILSPYKIPRRFIFLDRWPVDGRGKVDRRALEALGTEASPGQPAGD